jgi:pyruvate/2-oxoglutarate dehydrogenase complex dihydrolipoamide dehydrogenase (E3) component
VCNWRFSGEARRATWQRSGLPSWGVAVALIEERDLGGTCLNRGCIPTKALLKTSEMAYLIRKSKELGIAATLDDVDWNLRQKGYREIQRQG